MSRARLYGPRSLTSRTLKRTVDDSGPRVRRLRGVIDMVGGPEGAFADVQNIHLVGVVNGQFTLSGNAVVAKALRGTVDGAFDLDGALRITHQLEGEVDGIFEMRGHIFPPIPLRGVIEMEGGPESDLTVTRALVGEVDGTFDLYGDAQVLSPIYIAGEVDGEFEVEGDLTQYKARYLAGVVDGTFEIEGEITSVPVGSRILAYFAGEGEWIALYDPGNPTYRTMVSDEVQELRDVTGNSNAIAALAPERRPAVGAMGALEGMVGAASKGLSSLDTFDPMVGVTVTALVYRESSGNTPHENWIGVNNSTGGTRAGLIKQNGTDAFFLTYEGTSSGVPVDFPSHEICVVTYRFSAEGLELRLNGEVEYTIETYPSSNLTSIHVMSHRTNASGPIDGLLGPALIGAGDMSDGDVAYTETVLRELSSDNPTQFIEAGASLFGPYPAVGYSDGRSVPVSAFGKRAIGAFPGGLDLVSLYTVDGPTSVLTLEFAGDVRSAIEYRTLDLGPYGKHSVSEAEIFTYVPEVDITTVVWENVDLFEEGYVMAFFPVTNLMAVAHNTSPFLTIYDWNTGSPVKINDPAALPAGNGRGPAWSPDGRYLAVPLISSPFLTIYDWQTGSPVKISDPAALPAGQGNSVSWSPDGRYLAVAHISSPFLTIYDWQTGSPVKINDPAALPTGTGYGVAWSPDGRYLAVTHVSDPYLTIYDWNTGSPVKINDPAALPTSSGYGAAWSPDGRYMAVAHVSDPYLTIYDWNTGSPVKISDPAALPTGIGRWAAWSPDGRYMAVAHNNSPFLTIYDWQTGSPVKINDPAALPASSGYGAGWSPDGRYLAVAHNNSPFLTIYDWNTGSPVKINDPATLPAGSGRGVAWSPNT